ncbi:Serine/threonine-protein kinase sck1, partial [Candida maltosa Xu316]
MADFAKSIFGFGNQKKPSQSPTPPPSQQHITSNDYNQSPLSQHDNINQSYQQQPSSQQEQQQHQPQPSQQQPGTKFFPKGLVNATPTTAISDNSSVYGTTTTNINNYSEAYLNQTFKNNQPSQQTQYQQQFLASHFQPQPNQETTPVADSTPIKGKLKVTIMEAKDISATQPYVVCSFESSEFVTNPPDSYGKSPISPPGQHHHNQQNGPKNLYNSNHGPKALPMKNSNQRPSLYQRQLSTQHLNLLDDSTNPIWNHETIFDVVGSKSELDISVYDGAKDDAFLGHVRISPSTGPAQQNGCEWLQLGARITGETVSSGYIRIKWEYTPFDSSQQKRTYGPDDFQFLRLLGKGTFGQVFQVRKNDTNRIYAMKVLSKKVIVKKKEIAHTIGERNILVRTSADSSPFIVGLKFSFQTPADLFLVTDFMSGGELFFHLQKEGRFNEDRSKFYTAELILALEHLHNNDIVYRDLKPENILLDANGHIALCDFGLSKLNIEGTTNTFCGTTEYLAPEVLLDESGYTKMVDFWSLGVLIFEMSCGWSPFHAESTQQMYKNIAFGKVRFPKDVLSVDGRSFVKGLLNRNPKHRLGATEDAKELKNHPWFSDIDWNQLFLKNIPPPFKPHVTGETDFSNFDTEFTSEAIVPGALAAASGTPISPGIQQQFQGFTYVNPGALDSGIAGLGGFGLSNGVVNVTNEEVAEEVIEEDEDEDEEMGEAEDDDLIFSL